MSFQRHHIQQMLSEEKLEHLKDEWRTLVTESMAKAITAIEEHMPEAAEKHNTLLALKGRLNEANQRKIMGLLSEEQLQLLYNQLRFDLLTFIDELVAADFEATQEGGISFAIVHHPISQGEEHFCIRYLAKCR